MDMLYPLQGIFEQCLSVDHCCELFRCIYPLERLPCRLPEGPRIGFS
jgi:hypothetical protein